VAFLKNAVKPTKQTMKIKLWIPTLAIPLVMVACDSKETASEKMDAGADKVAEGVKEMADAAGKKTDKAMEDAKAAVEKAGDKTKEVAADAKEKIESATAEAKAKMDSAADATKAAAEDAKDKVKDAMKPDEEEPAPPP